VRCNGQLEPFTADTDRGGAFVLEGVPAGPLSFSAYHGGYIPVHRVDEAVSGNRTLDFVLVEQNGETDPRYRLHGGVSFQVPDGGANPGPAGSRVSIWSQDGSFQRTVETNGEARYEIGGIDPKLSPFMAGAAREGFIDKVVGPFSIVDSDKQQDFTLSLNPDYDWGPGSDGELEGCGCRTGGVATAGLLLVFLTLWTGRRAWSR
jgi:hypothetical protein